MSFLQTLFFESRLYLGIFSFALFAAVLLLRPRLESESFRKRSLPVVMLAIVGLFVLQTLVVTQHETILLRLDRFVNAIVEPNPMILSELVHDRYDAEQLDRQGFLDALDQWMDRFDVYDVRYRKRDVSVDGINAELELGVMATVQINKQPGQTHFGTWMIDWQQADDGAWRITSIRPIQIDGIQISEMRPYLR